MEKSSEGVITDSLNLEIGKLTQRAKQLNSLPNLARLQFIKHIKLAVGNLEDPHLSPSLKPILTHLLASCSDYLDSANDKVFILLCEQAIDLCSLGWSHLSYWICSEQALCYQIFWGLKEALAKHREQLGMYHQCCNDGAPRLSFYRPPSRKLS